MVRFVHSTDCQLRTAHPSHLPLTGEDEIFKNNPLWMLVAMLESKLVLGLTLSQTVIMVPATTNREHCPAIQPNSDKLRLGDTLKL